MTAASCPIMTDEQQAAIKPWAMFLFAWKVAQIIALVVGIIYYATVKPTDSRWSSTLFFGMVLIDRIILYYYAYRTAQIMGAPENDVRAALPSRSMVLWGLFFVAMMIVIWW
jgi:hypothetical protein